MIETLYPLTFPPGLKNNGTTFQSKDRWYKGNLVRFYQGTIRPVGGWVKRTLTGAPIVGPPHAAISWQTNDGSSYLAIGTPNGLYVVNSSNVVYDITPSALPTGTQWQLDIFGSYLVGVFNGGIILSSVPNVFLWTGDTALRASPAFASSYGPATAYGVVATPERFLVLLRGGDGTVRVGNVAFTVGSAGAKIY